MRNEKEKQIARLFRAALAHYDADHLLHLFLGECNKSEYEDAIIEIENQIKKEGWIMVKPESLKQEDEIKEALANLIPYYNAQKEQLSFI